MLVGAISKAHCDPARKVFQAAGAVKGNYAFDPACIAPPRV